MSERYKFGDVVEWSTGRWMIVRFVGADKAGREGRGYDAVWLGYEKGLPPEIRQVGDLGAIGIDYSKEHYLVSDD